MKNREYEGRTPPPQSRGTGDGGTKGGEEERMESTKMGCGESMGRLFWPVLSRESCLPYERAAESAYFALSIYLRTLMSREWLHLKCNAGTPLLLSSATRIISMHLTKVYAKG